MILDKEKERRRRVLMYTLFALASEITPNIRAVSVDWADNQIFLYFFFDGKFSPDDHEHAECIATEVICHFNEDSIETTCLDIPDPDPLPRLGKQFVFARKGTQFQPKIEAI
jgi:hypothetical protein